MSRRRFARASRLTIALALAAASARAEPPASVRVTLPDCATPPLDLDALTTALHVELGAAGIPLVSDPAAPGATELVLELEACGEEETELRVTVEFLAPSGSPVSLRTRLALGDVPRESRPRTVAVALAELLRVTRLPVEAAPPVEAVALPPASAAPERAEPRAPAPAPIASEPTPTEFAPPPGPLGVRVGVEVAWLAAGEDAFAGGAAELAVALPRGLVPRFGLSVLRNSVPTELGEIDLTALGAAAGVGYRNGSRSTFTVGPELCVRAVLARGRSRLGVTERIQLAWVTSSGLAAALGVPLSRRVEVSLGGFTDVVLWGAELTAGGQREVALLGLQGGGTVGISVR
ncbi:MAG: hypothetical protein JW751_02855 [Polyangiaceae bacterium]|nr:hypothetical protein [Polyangiaceae bacterium]